MKTLKTGVIALISLAVLSLAACKKDSSSSSSKTPQLSFQMQADNSLAASSTTGQTVNSIGTGITGLTFTAGIANISRFKLEAKKNGVETEISSKNLTNVDLFAISPSLVNATIAPGTYTEVEIKVELVHSNTDALPLKLTGSFASSGGTVIPVELDFNSDAEIKAEAENVTVTDSTNFSAIVHFHLNKLVAGISAADFDNATLTNGTIVISSTSNTAIYNKLLNNIANCGVSEFRHKGKDGKDHEGPDDNGHDGDGHDGNDH